MIKKIVRRAFTATQTVPFAAFHPLLQRVYAARQVKTIDALQRSADKLHPYQTLLNIDKAVALLARAIMTKRRMLVVGDFDADGATSTAVAIRALKSFGALDPQFLVPNRFVNGYGLTEELVAIAKPLAPDLIVTVDNGIANLAGVAAAKALNIQVVITDHHLPAQTLPNADVIVNPNQPGDVFPSKHLAGVGVIFYVMLALRRYLTAQDWFKQNALPEPNMARLLDLVALGTVADLVPLDHNNRILVYQGLCRIRAGQCVPGIIALLEAAGRDFSRVTAADLGFVVAARLNAAGRLDDMSQGIHCLLSDDSVYAREQARLLDKLNIERRSIEREMQTQALAILDKMNIAVNGPLPHGVTLYDESWHQGVIGILAARIKDRLHRPTIIFANGADEELKGSARSIAGLHIRDVLARIDALNPGLIAKFGGHAMAAGLTIKKSGLATFSDIFDRVVAEHADAAMLEHKLVTDGSLADSELTLEVATLLRDAGPWGQAFPEPLFDDVFQIIEQRIVGDKHLKLRLAKDNQIVDAILFFADLSYWPNHRCQSVHAIYRLDINEYKGQQKVQLIIDHLEAINADAMAT